jgi:hypothetical protein
LHRHSKQPRYQKLSFKYQHNIKHFKLRTQASANNSSSFNFDLQLHPRHSPIMSTPIDTPDATGKRFGDLNLSIIGLGTEYPPYLLDPSALDILTSRHYPESSAFVHFSIMNTEF